MCRKADQIFADNELWKSVPDRDRRELYEDIVHQLEKREKVSTVHLLLMVICRLENSKEGKIKFHCLFSMHVMKSSSAMHRLTTTYSALMKVK